MKIYLKYASLIFVVLIGLTACTEKKVEYFNLNYVVTKDLSVKPGDQLPNNFRLLSNYYLDSNCNNKIYVPNVVFIRPDLDKEKREELAPPLSSLNQFRKSLGLLSAVNLIEDYDENISNLKTPSILAEKSTKVIVVADMQNTYPNAMVVKLEKTGNEEIENLRKQISDKLCKNADTSEMFLVFDSSIKSPPQTFTTLSDEIKKENEKISSENPQERKKDAEKIVEKYDKKVTEDPFAMYQLTKTIIYGKDHHEAFEHMEKAVRLAIAQGKAQELSKLIDEDIKQDLMRDKNDRTIWRLTTPDHQDHWLPIIKALIENNASLLDSEDHITSSNTPSPSLAFTKFGTLPGKSRKWQKITRIAANRVDTKSLRFFMTRYFTKPNYNRYMT